MPSLYFSMFSIVAYLSRCSFTCPSLRSPYKKTRRESLAALSETSAARSQPDKLPVRNIAADVRWTHRDYKPCAWHAYMTARSPWNLTRTLYSIGQGELQLPQPPPNFDSMRPLTALSETGAA